MKGRSSLAKKPARKVTKKQSAKKKALAAKKTAGSKKPAAKRLARAKRVGPTDQTLKELHFKMVRIRRFEENAGRMMEDGKIPGALHLYVGEEAVAAGVMQHLSDEDQITSTHRGHGHLVA